MPYLAIRDPLADAKDTLSSWDKCMAKTYCKWPVIVGIIVGSLIILSVVLCVARCVCCAGEAACCCFKCCTCCCPSGGRSGHKRVKSEPPPPMPAYPTAYEPPIPPPAIDSRPLNQQYRSHAAPTFAPAPAPAPAQFARFDVTKKPANEDALPAMPEWSNAKTSHVEEEVIPEKRGDMEMERLNHNGSVTGTPVAGAVTGAAAVGAARRSPARSPVHRSPTQVSQDSYGFPAGYQNDSFVNAAPRRSPHNSPGPYGRQHGQQSEGYRGISPIESNPSSLSPVYGAGVGYAQAPQYGRRSPNQGYTQQHDRRSPNPEPFGQPVPRRSPTSPVQHDYGYGAQSQPQAPLDMPSPGGHHNDHYAAAAPLLRTPSPNYAPSGSTRYEPPAAAYPGQQAYEPASTGYPGQQTYQAFQPSQETQYSGVQRKPADGSWREV